MESYHNDEPIHTPTGLMAKLDTSDFDKARQNFADILGLAEPVSADVLVSALENDQYAVHLLATRGSPRFFDRLINNPPLKADSQAGSGQKLLAKFAGSMTQWAKAGFRTADQGIYQARIDACAACPHLRRGEQKGSLMARAGAAMGLGKSQCGLCGCFVETKAKMATESCPDVDPNGHTRWSRAELNSAKQLGK